MVRRDIIVIGASAGGIETLKGLVAKLPADLPAALFVVVHMTPEAPGVLGQILERSGQLPSAQAKDGEPIHQGRIYTARPDHHLLIQDSRVRVVRGPKENRSRPAIDPLFRSAAATYGPRVIGVVLTGLLNDGTVGLQAIKRCGGVTVVQDPADALFASMPQSALENVGVDYCLPVGDIPALLTRLVSEPVAIEQWGVPDKIQTEAKFAEGEMSDIEIQANLGKPSVFSCPECGGTLWELNDESLLRFRCRTGHAFTAQVLAAEQADVLEEALWIALRTLQEQASLSRHLAEDMRVRAFSRIAAQYEDRAQEAEQHAETIRQLLFTQDKRIEGDKD